MLSFILPIYKTEKHLTKCLKSLMAQSLTDWEAILVLDGPSEEAREIIKSTLKKSNYKIVEIEHGGASKARNEGFKHSAGEYVVFFDSDCAIECDAAKAWVELFEQKKDIGFIYAGYKWFEEQYGGYPSEPFDPYMLRVNNYISSCFPVRRELVQHWNEDLKSLQDWDFWLKVVEAGGKGHYMIGYAFSTPIPTKDSISGEGCTHEKWLERLEAVKGLHNIPIRTTCVTSLNYRHEGIRIAKMLDADYRDLVNDKPNRYTKIIQIGFDFKHDKAMSHCSNFKRGCQNFLFWTKDDIIQAYNMVAKRALDEYSSKINTICTQFVEDRESEKMMKGCGFNVTIQPLPFSVKDEPKPLPITPRFLVDISGHYHQIFSVIDKSLPDIKLDLANEAQTIDDYHGIIHFHREPLISNSVKRMLLNGRYVISNIEQPHMGYLDDRQSPDTFIPKIIDKIRAIQDMGLNKRGRDYYINSLKPEKLMEVLK